MLHIAPEHALSIRFKKNPSLNYLSADLYNPAAMEVMDICDIGYPENYFDIILYSHVLEHVKDDKKALREFWRVLKSERQAILLVPITTEATFEDPVITNPVQREKLFGQHDHVRRYGHDFPELVKLANFDVRSVAPEDLVDPAKMDYLGLNPNDVIFYCRKIA
jgi:SAM-dependent methyltransferase